MSYLETTKDFDAFTVGDQRFFGSRSPHPSHSSRSTGDTA